MDLSLLTQPYRESDYTGQTFLTNALGDERVTELLVVTAWVRASGMQLLVPGLEALRERGGTARLLFGVDLKGSSHQGVDLAYGHFTDSYAVHDPAGGTFHPKLYVAYGERAGYALIGSNNLTAGGLWHNYEAAVTATFDPRRDSQRLLAGVQEYAQRLIADTAICRKVTPPILRRLRAEGWLADEVRDRRRRNEDRPAADPGRRLAGSGTLLFAPSTVEKRSRPAPVGATAPHRAVPGSTRRRMATAPDTWWKRLPAVDAQRSPRGQLTGNVALVGVPEGQDRATFFRKVFFGGERWRRETVRGKRTELATIGAEVEIGRRRLGHHELTIVYRAYRAERGRATTVLRWGEALLEELRRRDVTGSYLLIERAGGGDYRVRVTARRLA